MKLLCEKNELLNALQIVTKAVPAKTTMSILQCVMIDAMGSEIRLIANDMELGIETSIRGDIEERGFIAVEARFLQDIVRKLPEGNVTIVSSPDNLVEIKSGKTHFKVQGRGSEEFTYLPVIEKIDGFVISQLGLKNIINQTIFSIGSGDTMMSGELLEVNADNLKVVALDGHRVSVRRQTLSDSFVSRKVVIPGKTLTEISRIMSDSTERMVEIYFTDKHIVFFFDSTMVVSRLMEGEFYNIDQMFSSDCETKMNVNRTEFLECLDRATLFVKEDDKKPVIININDEGMELKIQSTIGSMDENINIKKQGKDLILGFNPRFLMDALKSIEDEEVSFYFVNPKAPCFIRDEAGTYNYLILPVNIKVIR